MVDVLALGELKSDPRFASFAGRAEHKSDLLPMLENRLRQRSTAEWLGPLRAARVPCAPVKTVPDALTAPHAVARGLLVETEHPRWGAVRQLASPVRVGPPGRDRGRYRRAPRRNEDAAYVLGDIAGYTPDAITDLATSGAFGAGQPADASVGPMNTEDNNV
jgi:crotonobetainyl-CoA:carnitine CoA-transferase CaiB-like acyl-CoA transferase